MNKLNPISTPPENMTRVLVYTYFNKRASFDFAFYKDGMYQIGIDWFRPDEIEGWVSLNELRMIFNLEEQIKTHKVIYSFYRKNIAFVGTIKQCSEWVQKQNTFGYDILSMTREEIELYNDSFKFKKQPKPKKRIPIVDLDISVRCFNILKKLEIEYLDELSNFTKEEVQDMGRYGTKTLHDIEEVMRKNDVFWKEEIFI